MPLPIIIKPNDFWDEKNERFITVKETTLVLEHSLISISKWESKYKKPFLVEGSMSTPEEVIYYIKCMTIVPQHVDDIIYSCLKKEDIDSIIAYINDPMTATWFGEDRKPQKKSRKKEILTSEVIYWQMIALQIPQAYEKWHLNRLLTLIRVCSAKNEEQYGDKPKMSKADLLKRNAALNAQRRAKLHTKG